MMGHARLGKEETRDGRSEKEAHEERRKEADRGLLI